jgi:hypothetical protein
MLVNRIALLLAAAFSLTWLSCPAADWAAQALADAKADPHLDFGTDHGS